MNDISKVDKNFAEVTNNGKPIVWYDVQQAPFKIYGLMRTDDDARFCRIPESLALDSAVNDGIRVLYCKTAGGRVRFSTDSPYIALKWTFNKYSHYPHMPATGTSGFDLYLDREPVSMFYRIFVPPVSAQGCIECGARATDGEMNRYTLNFPLYNNVDKVYVGLKPGARLEEGAEYKYKKPIVFYGSSITQGGCASRPGMAFASIAARRLDSDHINLGFSGSGLAEKEMMEHIASIDAGVFVYDYDHNAPTVEHLEKTHERGYKIYRRKRPDTPVVIVSLPNWGGENAKEAVMRRDVIYRTYSNAVRSGDKNVAFVDGRSFFAGPDRYDCTVDGSHPNDLGMSKMADGIVDAIEYFIRNI